MTTIKKNNGMMTITHAEGDAFLFIRKRISNKEVEETVSSIAQAINTPVVEASVVVEEYKGAEIPRFNQPKQETVLRDSTLEMARRIREGAARDTRLAQEEIERIRRNNVTEWEVSKLSNSNKKRKQRTIADIIAERKTAILGR